MGWFCIMRSPSRQSERSNDLEFVLQSQRKIRNMEFTKRKTTKSQNKGLVCNPQVSYKGKAP